MHKLLFSFLIFLFAGCTNEMADQESPLDESEPTEAEQIVDLAVKEHGGERYESAHYSFTFRDRDYAFHNKGDQFEYIRIYRPNADTVIKDVMNNESFVQTINEVVVELDKENIDRYKESINSVVYFATLPHKLKDASVNKVYLGVDTIKGKTYDAVKVTFNQDGGGKDYQDEYMYWFGQESHLMDYFAYNYQVNGGGVRFRVAYNPRTIDGIRFQDYENYAAPLDEPLRNLPQLYEMDSLELVSLIESENIQSIE